MEKIYDTLQQLNITYTKKTHPPVYTAVEASQYYAGMPGARAKNLFLRNRKGNQHYLVVITDTKTADLKQLAKLLGESQLGFASPERLYKYLQVKPGSVSPLGLVFDTEAHVHVVVDADVMDFDVVNFHPNDNINTLTFSTTDFKRFLEHGGNPLQFIKL